MMAFFEFWLTLCWIHVLAIMVFMALGAIFGGNR